MRKLVWIVLFLLVVAAGGGAGLVWVDYTMPGPWEGDAKTMVFKSGSGFRGIAQKLEDEGIIRHALVFQAMGAVSGKARSLKPGEYQFEYGISAESVMQMMADGKTVIRKVTLPEGRSVTQAYQIVTQAEAMEGEVSLPLREGEVLPETYYYTFGDNRAELWKRMQDDMKKTLAAAWQGRANDLPFTTPEEALTLASIVEKETGKTEERKRVAAVYINRLRKGMKLQADPTTVYALTKGQVELGRALTYKDLETDSPYNTYFVAGLPPGPIANPGKASIEAVMNPDVTDELYFVADGQGGHRFAKTLDEHNANVRQYRAALQQQKAD